MQVNPGVMKAVIFDLDGTLSCNAKRLDSLRNGDWDTYEALSGEDAVLEGQAALLRLLHTSGHIAIIMTSRPIKLIEPTKEWLKRNHLPFDLLMMREGEPQWEFKVIALKRLLNFSNMSVELFLDDDPENCKAATELGIPTVYVHSGYYDSVRVPPRVGE